MTRAQRTGNPLLCPVAHQGEECDGGCNMESFERDCFWCCEPMRAANMQFCSIPCRKAYQTAERFIRLVQHRTDCRGCGQSFVPRALLNERRKNTYCSRQCAWDHHEHYQADPETPLRQAHLRAVQAQEKRRFCEVCFSGSGTSLTCSEECKLIKSAKEAWLKGEAEHVSVVVKCKECGAEHHTEYGSPMKVFCSYRCGKRFENRIKSRQGNHRRRARHFGVAYEPIRRSKVLNRDGWRCGICSRRISKRRKYPDPRSPSLDHIVPMASGGGHLYNNVQAAHLVCNSLKGVSPAGSQLVMLGGV